jgi:hypothetical protein
VPLGVSAGAFHSSCTLVGPTATALTDVGTDGVYGSKRSGRARACSRCGAEPPLSEKKVRTFAPTGTVMGELNVFQRVGARSKVKYVIVRVSVGRAERVTVGVVTNHPLEPSGKTGVTIAVVTRGSVPSSWGALEDGAPLSFAAPRGVSEAPESIGGLVGRSDPLARASATEGNSKVPIRLRPESDGGSAGAALGAGRTAATAGVTMMRTNATADRSRV